MAASYGYRLLAMIAASTVFSTVVVFPGASAVITPALLGQDVVDAIATFGPLVGSFATTPPLNAPNAVSDTPLAGFPTDGTEYGILTTGSALIADAPNTSPSSSVNDGGTASRGDTVYDLTVLQIAFTVPRDGCTVAFQYRYLTEEYPEYVGSVFNDAFIAEIDSNSWAAAGGVVAAPNAFVLQSVNTGVFAAANAAGTTYDGATATLNAVSPPLTAGAHTLYLSIVDQGDANYDSAVFLDALRVACFPPGHITIHRFSTAGTVLLASPPGWDCVDIQGGASVSPGSQITTPNPGVRCTPPPSEYGQCKSVTAGGYHAWAGTGTMTVTSTCTTAPTVSVTMTLPFNDPGVSASMTGFGLFPWTCSAVDTGVSRDADYWVFCDVNAP